MFDFLSWGHLLVIGLAALFIFGPERLPTLAQDAARGIRQVRAVTAAVRRQLDDELGEDFTDLRALDLRRYHPRTFLRAQLLGEDEASPSPTGRTTASSGAMDEAGVRTLPPPFDAEAT
ncbi:MAG: tatB [Blastococcus sp.]|jgi:sec-independent protein translocase protein TatB|nr:tatB [Blastococcus sp.]